MWGINDYGGFHGDRSDVVCGLSFWVLRLQSFGGKSLILDVQSSWCQNSWSVDFAVFFWVRVHRSNGMAKPLRRGVHLVTFGMKQNWRTDTHRRNNDKLQLHNSRKISPQIASQWMTQRGGAWPPRRISGLKLSTPVVVSKRQRRNCWCTRRHPSTCGGTFARGSSPVLAVSGTCYVNHN